jgi:preprotein translocase subunit YajC
MMVSKALLFLFLFTISYNLANAQENRLLVKHNHQEKSLKKGDNVRFAYPSNLLEDKRKNVNEIVGIRGIIDSISKENIWIKTDIKNKKTIKILTKDILSIKKISGGGQFLAFLITYGVIGGSVLAITNALDLNSGIKVFSTVVDVFQAAIITSNVL